MNTIKYQDIYDAIQVIESRFPDNPEIATEIAKTKTLMKSKFGTSAAFYLDKGRRPTANEMLDMIPMPSQQDSAIASVQQAVQSPAQKPATEISYGNMVREHLAQSGFDMNSPMALSVYKGMQEQGPPAPNTVA